MTLQILRQGVCVRMPRAGGERRRWSEVKIVTKGQRDELIVAALRAEPAVSLRELGNRFNLSRQRVHQIALKHAVGSYGFSNRRYIFRLVFLRAVRRWLAETGCFQCEKCRIVHDFPTGARHEPKRRCASCISRATNATYHKQDASRRYNAKRKHPLPPNVDRMAIRGDVPA